MAFCASCGAEVQGKFCAKCGAPAGAASGAAGTAGPPPPSAPYVPAPAASAGLEENVAAALCYLLGVLTGVLFLVIEPYSRNRVIRFHAFQSIFAWIAAIVIGMVLSTISYIFVSIPFIGWIIYILLWTAFSLGILGLWLFLMYKAYNKERFVLPVVGAWAEKQAQS
ncbi:MAG: hypothetical protein LAP61_05865 [Acidobacteriia bacterium]|nr:hypothetical protein [Terriglobia bacterium]